MIFFRIKKENWVIIVVFGVGLVGKKPQKPKDLELYLNNNLEKLKITMRIMILHISITTLTTINGFMIKI